MKTETLKECINIEHLGFSYDTEEPVLRDVNLYAVKGESIGLIGANGIGKSTLLKLLVGLDGPGDDRVGPDGHCYTSYGEGECESYSRTYWICISGF